MWPRPQFPYLCHGEGGIHYHQSPFSPCHSLILLGDAGNGARQAACRLFSLGKLIQSSMLQSINYWPVCFRNIKGTFKNCTFHSMLQSKDLGAFRCLSSLKPQLESISPSLHWREHHFKAGTVCQADSPLPLPTPCSWEFTSPNSNWRLWVKQSVGREEGRGGRRRW